MGDFDLHNEILYLCAAHKCFVGEVCGGYAFLGSNYLNDCISTTQIYSNLDYSWAQTTSESTSQGTLMIIIIKNFEHL
jgi:hypothetical protein